jgi:hypothetical protein
MSVLNKNKQFLDSLIEQEVKRMFIEQEEIDTNNGEDLEMVQRYIEDEKKNLKNNINMDGKIMSALSNPLERNLKQKQINLNKEKLKNIDKIEKDLETQKGKNSNKSRDWNCGRTKCYAKCRYTNISSKNIYNTNKSTS